LSSTGDSDISASLFTEVFEIVLSFAEAGIVFLLFDDSIFKALGFAKIYFSLPVAFFFAGVFLFFVTLFLFVFEVSEEALLFFFLLSSSISFSALSQFSSSNGKSFE